MRGVTSVVRSLMALGVVGLIASCADGPTAPERNTPAVSLAVGQAATGETITTDKDDYAPGETVTITGSGWQAGDSVDFVLTEDPSTHEPETWTVGVDEADGFLDDHFVVQEHDLDVTFTLTATSRATGATAQTTFTDHGPSPVTSSTFAISANASYLVTVSVTLGGGSSSVTLTAATAKVANQTLATTVDVTLTSPGSPGNGSWSGNFQGACETTYKINNVGVTWHTTHDHNSTETPGATVSVTTGACVSANQEPTANAGGTYSGNEGAAIDLDGTGSSDPDGDTPLTYSWTIVLPLDAAFDGGSCSLDDATAAKPKITCNDDGVVKVGLVVTDSKGLSSTNSAEATVNVANVAPVVNITAPVDWAMYQLGPSIPISATFSDDGSNDTHTCEIKVTKYLTTTTLVDFGADVLTPCATTLTPDEAAVYTIRVTIKDDDGGSSYDEVMIIVYDPTAGFVTGGGWIDSPWGAYAPNPDLVGKATFGFVSKYEKSKGSSTPVLTGNTEFVFHAADFNFHSSSYEYLLVNANGTRAQFKGTGTVNGQAGYGFMLTALDGSPDKFRIKIWDSGGTVYDNQMLMPDSGLDATTLGGGSIVIHVAKK
jgi:PKD domain